MKRILGVLTTICALVGCQPNRAMYQSVDIATFAEIIQDSNVVLLDVRTQSEYEAGHIPNAILIDVTQADFLPKCKQQLPLDKTIALYCRSGNRSKKAAQLLSQKKYTVVELNTGFNSWKGKVEK
ncbi:MAG: rhodanese-like domain-containing protein [Bacteroidales bacterium]|nr:rhodanese-like domain-containing protein [Bacteroidales bacterium]